MTTSEKHTLLLSAAEALIILVLSLLLFNAYRKPTDVIEVPIEIRDTITVTQERIIEHTKLEYVTVYDTIVKVETETDTFNIPVELPIEHCIYEDTLKTDSTEVELKVQYSGFRPSLDSIGISYHYVGERAVNVKKSGFSGFVGVCAYTGAGLYYNPIERNYGVGCPEVGIGVCVGWGYHWK